MRKNAKIKTQRIRGDQEACCSWFDSSRTRGVRQAGGEGRSKSFTASRAYRQRGDFLEQRGQTVPGGILDRLIVSVRNEIAESEKKTADLKEYLSELELLSEQLLTKAEK